MTTQLQSDAGRTGDGSSSRLNQGHSHLSNGYRHEWTAEAFEAMHKAPETYTCTPCKFTYDARFGACPICRRDPVVPCDVCRKPVLVKESHRIPAVLNPVCYGCAVKAVAPMTYVPNYERAMTRV